MLRDSRRRRNFSMEDADEDSYDSHFTNTNLDQRSQIFNSESQVGSSTAVHQCIDVLPQAVLLLG